MVPKELLDYANDLLSKGYDLDRIIQVLKQNGYTDAAIDELKKELANQSVGKKTDGKEKISAGKETGKRPSLFSVYKNPLDYFLASKQFANFKEPILILSMLGLISGILQAISLILTYQLTKSVPGMLSMFGYSSSPLWISIPMALIQGCIASIAGGFIYAGVFYLFIRIFKGEGRFVELFHSYAQYIVATTLLMIPVMILAFGLGFLGAAVKSIGTLIIIITIMLTLYLLYYILYMQTMMIKAISSLSTLKSVLVWLLPTIILFIVFAASMLLLGVLFARTFVPY